MLFGGTGVPTQAQPQESAALSLTLEGVDLSGVALVASSGWAINGRVITDTGSVPNAARERFNVAAWPLDADNMPGGLPPPPPPAPGPRGFGNSDSGRLRDDWTFTVTNVFGAARLHASLPDGWAVKSILLDGRDISDSAVEMKSGEEIGGVQVIVTNRVTSVSGQLADSKGVPLADGTIVVFAADADKWSEDSRWVRAVRPDQEGRYQVKGLPPGEYLAIAVDYVEDGMWNDPAYLASIRRFAQRLTLGDGDSSVMSLKLVSP